MASGGQLEATSEAFIEYECTVCLKNNKIKNAARYCFDCQKYMCSECLRIHDNFGDKHNVLSVTDTRVQNVLTEKCEAHPDKVLEYFCRQHDVVVCQACFLLDHRACKDVKHIGESVDDLTADPDILAIPGHLQSALDHVNQVMEAIDKHVERIREKEEMLLNELEEYITTILSKIEDMRKRGIDDISDTHRKLTTNAKENRQACEDIKADLSKYASEIDRSKDRQAHIIVLKKKSQALARKAESFCKESERMLKETSFNFIFNMALVEELDKCNSPLVHVKRHKFNIRNLKDRSESISIRGCCCLDDGTILLLDDTNKKLKRLDPVSNSVTDVLSLSEYYQVYGVCSVGPQKVAVAAQQEYFALSGGKSRYSTPDLKRWCIVLYDVAKRTKTGEIGMDHGLSCIAYHSGDLFVGSLKSLHVYNMAGTKKLEISNDSFGSPLFSSIASIIVNKRGDRIYVADRDIGLICLNIDGKEIFTLTNEQLGLSRATGVTTDHRNQVLICGYDSQNLVQVTEKGKVIGEILSGMDGIKKPRCMCFDDVRQKLYVGGNIDHILGLDFMQS